MGKKITIAIFCVILFGFTIASIVYPDASYSVRERDTLTTLSDVTEDGDLLLMLSDLASGDFQETYEEYVDDQFFLRETWIDLSTTVSTLLGKQDVNGVYIGKDGYLLERYTDEYFLDLEEDDFTAEDDPLWVCNAQALSEFLAAMTAEYGSGAVHLLMIPSKANVLTDDLPDLASVYPEDEIVEEICTLVDDAACEYGLTDDTGEEIEELSEKIVLDLTDVLSAHQDEYIYYRTDHHWTTRGAYYAAAAYLELCGMEAAPLDSYESETATETFYGTTYNKLHTNTTADTITLYHSEDLEHLTVNQNDGELVSDSLYFYDNLTDYTDEELLEMVEDDEEINDKYSVFLNGNTQKIVIETGAGTGRTLLLLKDSFANSFVPFLCGSYDTIILYDDRYEGDNDIETILADYGDQITDVLVLYNVEKFMENTNFGL